MKGSDSTETAIAMLPMLSDNYAWVLHDGAAAVVVDPGDAKPVLRFCKRQNLTLSLVLLTHHHGDHCAGAEELKRMYKCTIVGPADARMRFVDDTVRDADVRTVLGGTMEVIATPGHTKTHVVYRFPGLHAIFTGDTLFCAGCGRLLEGSAAEMLQSLIKCTGFDDVTSVYCGHEYTKENLMFAAMVEPDNKDVLQRLANVKYGLPTVPSTIAAEKATNPFLRSGSPGIRKKLGMEIATGVEVFAELRRRKDRF